MATYYVDQTGGSDPANGTSTGAAWKTIAKVNGSSFSAGDSILFKCGEVWREQLTVPSSGSSGHPITFGVYGAGAAPIIDGSDVLSSWTSESLGGTDLTADANLFAYHYFENNWSDGTAKGNTFNAITSAPTFVTSPVKQGTYAVQFLGSSSQHGDRTDANLSAGFPGKTGTTTTNLTFGVWARPTLGSTIMGTINKGAAYTLVFRANNTIQVNVFLDGGGQVVTSDGTWSANAWYHLVGRVNSVTKLLELFINGVKQLTSYAATSTTVGTNGSNWRAGFDSVYGAFTGQLDEVFVFNRALSDAEILGIYSHGLNGSIGGGTIYFTSASTESKQVFQGSVRLAKAVSKAALVAGSFFHDAGASRLYVRTSGDDSVTGYVITGSRRTYGVIIDTHDYVTVTGITATKANLHGVASFTSNGTTVDGVESSYNYMAGIIQYRASGADTVAFTNNTVHHNGGIGIELDAASGSLVSKNSVYNNDILELESDQSYGAGIKVGGFGNIGNVIEMNDVYLNGTGATGSGGDNQDRSGIWLDTVGAGNHVRFNRVHSNLKYGIFNEASAGNFIYGNVIFGHVENTNARGLLVGRGSSGVVAVNNTIYGNRYGLAAEGDNGASGLFQNNTLQNNISVGNAVSNFRALGGGQNDLTNGSGNVYTYNNFGSEVASFIEWGAGTFKSTYAAFDTAYGGATHSIAGDPLLTNAAGGDFSLQSGSPAKNTGAGLGLSYRLALNPVSVWPAMVKKLDQRLNGIGWEVGAYVFDEGGGEGTTDGPRWQAPTWVVPTWTTPTWRPPFTAPEE